MSCDRLEKQEVGKKMCVWEKDVKRKTSCWTTDARQIEWVQRPNYNLMGIIMNWQKSQDCNMSVIHLLWNLWGAFSWLLFCMASCLLGIGKMGFFSVPYPSSSLVCRAWFQSEEWEWLTGMAIRDCSHSCLFHLFSGSSSLPYHSSSWADSVAEAILARIYTWTGCKQWEVRWLRLWCRRQSYSLFRKLSQLKNGERVSWYDEN